MYNRNKFSSASFSAGVLSLFLIASGLSFSVGAFGILFALLSKKGDRMDSQARFGCILSVIGFSLGLVMLVYTLMTRSDTAPDILQQYQQIYDFYQQGT